MLLEAGAATKNSTDALSFKAWVAALLMWLEVRVLLNKLALLLCLFSSKLLGNNISTKMCSHATKTLENSVELKK